MGAVTRAGFATKRPNSAFVAKGRRASASGIGEDVWVIFFLLVAVRIFLPWEVLDQFEHYTHPGGSFAEKIHIAAYGIFLVSALFLIFNPGRATRMQAQALRGAVWLAAGVGATILLTLLTGRTQGASYLLDSILVAPAAAIVIAQMSPMQLHRLFRSIVILLLLNDMLAFVEYIAHIRFLPYPNSESFFRPTALLGHPLINGLLNATAIPFVFLAPWRIAVRMFLATVFFVTCFAVGARAASIAAVAAMMACLWLYLRRLVAARRIDRGMLVVGGAASLVLVAIAVGAVVATGLADRLIEYGFSDQSAIARFNIYSVFDFMSVQQILFGMPRPQYEYLASTMFSDKVVESPVVLYTFEFGIVGATIVVAAILRYLWGLGAGKSALLKLGVFVFLLVGSTNTTFSGKSPAMIFVTVLAMSGAAYLAPSGRMMSAKGA